MTRRRPLRKAVHDLFGLHLWVADPWNGAKRHCSCGAEEWFFEKRFPRVGQPAHFWQRMDLPEQGPRRHIFKESRT